MTTGCMRSTLEPEHRLMTQESKRYKEARECLVDRKSEMKDDDALCAQNQEADQQKKPRRKDTPVLNSHPHIPERDIYWAQKIKTVVHEASFGITTIWTPPPIGYDGIASAKVTGVRLLKAEKQMVHSEDEEKDLKE